VSEPKFSPGPWTTSGEDKAILVADARGRYVGEVHDDDPPGSGEPNAALIKEAPNLYALLAELIDIEGPQPGHVMWYRKVQAALAKARGEP
jgi:hypothetical protein